MLGSFKNMLLVFVLILSLFVFNCSYTKAQVTNEVKEELYTSALGKINADDLELVPIDEDSEQDKPQVKWLETLRPKDFVLLNEITQIIKDKKLDSYKKDLEARYKETPDVFSSAITYGLLLIDLGEYEKANLVFERAIKDFKSNQTPIVYKGWVDICRGNYIQAKDALYPTVMEKINTGITGINSGIWLPYHVDAVVGLYLLKNNLPEKDKAEIEKIVNDIAKHFLTNPRFASILISEDLNQGRIQEATENFSIILPKSPEDPTILTLLGTSQLLTGHLDEALTLFDQVNDLYPFSTTSYLMKARTLHLMKKKEEANVLIEKAFQLDPQLKKLTKEKDKLLLAKTYKVERKAYKIKPVKKANKD